MLLRFIGARSRRGVSLPELMIVIALLALAAMVAIPLTARRIQEMRLRAAAQHVIVSLRAARMSAVSSGREVQFTVEPDPSNRYRYGYVGVPVNPHGPESFELPAGMRIEPESTATIVFRATGALVGPAAARVVLDANLWGGSVERWTVDVPLSGIPSVTHEATGEGAGGS